jgi:hypothetical protein
MAAKQVIDINHAMVHYRYSELPSTTNEINLLTFEQAGKVPLI